MAEVRHHLYDNSLKQNRHELMTCVSWHNYDVLQINVFRSRFAKDAKIIIRNVNCDKTFVIRSDIIFHVRQHPEFPTMTSRWVMICDGATRLIDRKYILSRASRAFALRKNCLRLRHVTQITSTVYIYIYIYTTSYFRSNTSILKILESKTK